MPTNGGGFQDDIYLWSHDRGFLQHKLNVMVRSLGERNLRVNATKTKYVHTVEGKQTVKVGEKEVTGDKDGTVTVLGAPVALAGEVVQVLAEVARRARGAFATRKKLLTGAGSLDHKLLAHTRYVSTSALWAIGAAHPHDALLKGLNSIQLMQLRQVLAIKRKPLEQWAQWNQRSLRQARVCLAKRPAHRWSTMALTTAYRVDARVAQSGMVASRTRKSRWPTTPAPVQCHDGDGENGGEDCQAVAKGSAGQNQVEKPGGGICETL